MLGVYLFELIVEKKISELAIMLSEAFQIILEEHLERYDGLGVRMWETIFKYFKRGRTQGLFRQSPQKRWVNICAPAVFPVTLAFCTCSGIQYHEPRSLLFLHRWVHLCVLPTLLNCIFCQIGCSEQTIKV